MSPTLYILVGPPGVGKSTWTRQHLRTTVQSTRVVSSDNIVEETALLHGVTYSEAWNFVDQKWIRRQTNADFDRAIEEGSDIIVDRTNMTLRGRRMFLSRTPKTYEKRAVIFQLSRLILNERLENRARETGKIIPMAAVDRMLASYEAPDFVEFDAIVTFFQ